MLNLDTHILLYAISDQLHSRERKLLSTNQWSISSIVLWELSKLVQIKRVDLDLESNDLSRFLAKIHIWPLSLAIAIDSTRLDIAGDPADEIIAATSLVHQVPLITRDKAMLKSKIVPLVA